MINIPSKIFERNINDIEIGISEIHLYSSDEMNEAQIGYQIDTDGNEIKEWIGKNYLVIGNDSCCGDPIIVKTDEDKLPVYSMFHDDWDSIELIANSFKQYISILEKINGIDLENKDECKNILEDIKSIVPNESYDYWEGLIRSAYEFLTDEDY